MMQYEKEPPEKESWQNEFAGCFSSVLSFFNREEYDSSWYIDYKNLSDLKFIGSGSQGQIYSGLMKDELVAIKKVREIQETELKHLRKLKHINIVELYGVCVEEPEYCIVMEYCQYGTLYSFIHSGIPLNPVSITQWSTSIATGMEYLHRNNIIHRDLKSLNILLGDDLVAKVTDFGTACEWNSMLTKMKTFAGTVAWMAPEVIRNEAYNEKIDVWSFGVVLWELLTQAVPYKEMDSPAIMWGVGTHTISLPIPQTCPSGLRLLLSQCFSKNPDQRPPFKIIVNHLEIAKEEFLKIRDNEFTVTQSKWRTEVDCCMQDIFAAVTEHVDHNNERRRLLNDCRALYRAYETNLERANEIYLETCALRLHLEQREKAIEERELNHIRCSCKRTPLRRKMQVSSTTDLSKCPGSHLNRVEVPKKPAPARTMFVQLADNSATSTSAKTVTSTVSNEELQRMCAARNNNIVKRQVKKIDTVVEFNGNVDGESDSHDNNDNEVSNRVRSEV